VLRPLLVDPESDQGRVLAAHDAVEHQHSQRQIRELALQSGLQGRRRRLDEPPADRALARRPGLHPRTRSLTGRPRQQGADGSARARLPPRHRTTSCPEERLFFGLLDDRPPRGAASRPPSGAREAGWGWPAPSRSTRSPSRRASSRALSRKPSTRSTPSTE
jgi:hypothetical protein